MQRRDLERIESEICNYPACGTHSSAATTCAIEPEVDLKGSGSDPLRAQYQLRRPKIRKPVASCSGGSFPSQSN